MSFTYCIRDTTTYSCGHTSTQEGHYCHNPSFIPFKPTVSSRTSSPSSDSDSTTKTPRCNNTFRRVHLIHPTPCISCLARTTRNDILALAAEGGPAYNQECLRLKLCIEDAVMYGAPAEEFVGRLKRLEEAREGFVKG